MTMNDNHATMDGRPHPLPDAHGQAALLLVESLIHGLCEKSALTVDEAVEIVERAISVQMDQADEGSQAAASMWRSHAMLTSIVASLRIDESVPSST